MSVKKKNDTSHSKDKTMTTDTQPTHTPAPIQKWNVGENDRGHGRKSYAVIPADFENYEIIAESPTMTYERARLIAAAPELLEALEHLQMLAVSQDLSGTDTLHHPIWSKVSNALAKARG